MNEAIEHKKQKQKAASTASRKVDASQPTPSAYYLSDGIPTILSSSVTERTPLTQHTDTSPIAIECIHDKNSSYQFEGAQPSHTKQTLQVLVSRDSQNSEVKSRISGYRSFLSLANVPNHETFPEQPTETPSGTEIETDIAKELEEAADTVQPDEGDDSV